MSKLLGILLASAIVIFLSLSMWEAFKESEACKAKGGIEITTTTGHACIRVPLVK